MSESKTFGTELLAEINWLKLIKRTTTSKKISSFINLSLIDARYVNSDEPAYHNKKVELVPPITIRTVGHMEMKSFLFHINIVM